MDDDREIARGIRVQAYVAGTLSADDRAQFERELAVDPALRELVAMEQLLSGTLERQGELRFRDVVQEASDALSREDGTHQGTVVPIQRKMAWVWWAAAACVVGVLLVAQLFKGPSNQALAQAYAEASLPVVRSGAEAEQYSGVEVLDRALDQLRSGDAADALRTLQGAGALGPGSDCKHNWLLALAYLGSDREDEADAALAYVIQAACYPEASLAKQLNAER